MDHRLSSRVKSLTTSPPVSPEATRTSRSLSAQANLLPAGALHLHWTPVDREDRLIGRSRRIPRHRPMGPAGIVHPSPIDTGGGHHRPGMHRRWTYERDPSRVRGWPAPPIPVLHMGSAACGTTTRFPNFALEAKPADRVHHSPGGFFGYEGKPWRKRSRPSSGSPEKTW